MLLFKAYKLGMFIWKKHPPLTKTYISKESTTTLKSSRRQGIYSQWRSISNNNKKSWPKQIVNMKALEWLWELRCSQNRLSICTVIKGRVTTKDNCTSQEYVVLNKSVQD